MGASASTLLDAAASGEPSRVVSALDTNPNLEAVGAKGRTALTIIVRSSMTSAEKATCIEALARRGTNMNARCIRGWTALHYAVHAGDAACVSALLREGAKCSLRDIYGRTALQLSDEVRGPGQAHTRDLLLGAHARENIVEPYSLVCPSVVHTDEPLEVTFRTKPEHSTYDYVQIYYCIAPHITMSPRLGSYQYVPPGVAEGTLFLDMRTVAPGSQIRAVYVLGDQQTPVVASDVVEVHTRDSDADETSTVESELRGMALDGDVDEEEARREGRPPSDADSQDDEDIPLYSDEDEEDELAATFLPAHTFPWHFVPLYVRELLPPLQASEARRIHDTVMTASANSATWQTPAPTSFTFKLREWDPLRRALLRLVPQLRQALALAVPAQMTLKDFWRNYFYNVLRLVGHAYGADLDARMAVAATTARTLSSETPPPVPQRADLGAPLASPTAAGDRSLSEVAVEESEPKLLSVIEVVQPDGSVAAIAASPTPLLTAETFLRTRVPDEFEYDLAQHVEDARAALERWPQLDIVRFKLVPARLAEETFWRIFAYLLEQHGDFSEPIALLPSRALADARSPTDAI